MHVFHGQTSSKVRVAFQVSMILLPLIPSFNKGCWSLLDAFDTVLQEKNNSHKHYGNRIRIRIRILFISQSYTAIANAKLKVEKKREHIHLITGIGSFAIAYATGMCFCLTRKR
ncbi:hypothetical protein HKD37_13G037399 [Glycine soja]